MQSRPRPVPGRRKHLRMELLQRKRKTCSLWTICRIPHRCPVAPEFCVTSRGFARQPGLHYHLHPTGLHRPNAAPSASRSSPSGSHACSGRSRPSSSGNGSLPGESRPFLLGRTNLYSRPRRPLRSARRSFHVQVAMFPNHGSCRRMRFRSTLAAASTCSPVPSARISPVGSTTIVFMS